MRTLSLVLLLAFILAAAPASSLAQNWGTVAGRVTDASSGETLEGVTVLIQGTDFGTATASDGRFSFRLPTGSYAVRFSFIGYQAITDSVTVRRDAVTELAVRLLPSTFELDEVTVEERPVTEVGVYELTPREITDIPSPFRGFRALKVLPGVATNSEMTNQYSVRGGGFNENLVFINGFEVFMPFRVRQGEQEGLGLFNPEMSQGVRLYTGGFPARYGGKLSSALEIEYGPPRDKRFSASAYASLLDGGATVGYRSPGDRAEFVASARRARAQRFFATQERKGEYEPDYTDVQLAGSVALAHGHRVELLGIYADHTFELEPSNQKTYFGIVSTDPSQPSDLQALWLNFEGTERDRSEVLFGGARLYNSLLPGLNIAHSLSYFSTREEERFHISGEGVLYQVDPGGDPGSGSGHFPTGNARQEDRASNDVQVDMLTADGRYRLLAGPGALEAGWSARRLTFADAIDEKAVVVGPNAEGETVRVVIDSLRDAATVSANQVAAYTQYTYASLDERLMITGGVRTDYFDFNDEWTVSPRLSARYEASDQVTLNASVGVYHQEPTYQELRGKPKPGEGVLGSLNRDIKSQRSLQLVTGIDYFLPSRRLYLRAEAYYKRLSNLISYDIENVRVRYSGENDARGYTYGFDTQIRGELVPGLESWINYSFLVSRESFLPAFVGNYREGSIPRPTDQRHTFSVFVQDYVPGDETWKLHLRGLFGSGLPYTPPVEGPKLGNLVLQIPGPRSSARFTEYMRVDLGVTKTIYVTGDSDGGVRLNLTGELLNAFDMVNTVAYSWVPGGDGVWRRIPTRLTPRTINVRARLEF